MQENKIKELFIGYTCGTKVSSRVHTDSLHDRLVSSVSFVFLFSRVGLLSIRNSWHGSQQS